MNFFKPKIRYFEDDLDGVIVQVKNGKGVLQKNFSSSRENGLLSVSYKNHLLYTASDDLYWCPTCERMIRRYYSDVIIDEQDYLLSRYRKVMGDKEASFDELLEANRLWFELLASGYYRVSLRAMYPTYGGEAIFSDFENEEKLPASVESYYEYMDNEPIYFDGEAVYMLPTQKKEALSETVLQTYRQKNYLGRGLIYGFVGFLGCLLDGHHKATVAYERNTTLECFVIEPVSEPKTKLIPYSNAQSRQQSDKLSEQKILDLPRYCYLHSLLEDYSKQELDVLIKQVVKKEIYVQEGLLSQLVIYCYQYNEKELFLFYPIVMAPGYREVREEFFRLLSRLPVSEELDKIMLDYLINDEYDNRVITQICDDYFAKQMN